MNGGLATCNDGGALLLLPLKISRLRTWTAPISCSDLPVRGRPGTLKSICQLTGGMTAALCFCPAENFTAPNADCAAVMFVAGPSEPPGWQRPTDVWRKGTSPARAAGRLSSGTANDQGCSSAGRPHVSKGRHAQCPWVHLRTKWALRKEREK
jgi:hypothetical protein